MGDHLATSVMDPTTYPYSFSSDAATAIARSSTSSDHPSSPTTSTFSQGHSSKGSASSVASSPGLRESLDVHVAAKRLEDVTEEPWEKDEFEGYTLVDETTAYSLGQYDKPSPPHHDQFTPPVSPVQADWPPGDDEDWPPPTTLRRHFKRPKSLDYPQTPNNTHRFSSKFGSLSRRWKNRSAAGPQLSIVTHTSVNAPPSRPGSRPGSLTPSQILSPALSAISRHESLIPSSSPVGPLSSVASLETDPRPVDAEESDHDEPEEQDQAQATTPLLPPVLVELCQREEPYQSPLQSPSIAPTSAVMSSRTSLEYPLSCLPTPPLSTQPSIISMRNRSRTNTLTNSPLTEIPPMNLLEDPVDPWAARLGHADFTIYPEPYVPATVDLTAYTLFRKDWDQARTNYAKHITRTAEHYGSTSKVYKWTEAKWTAVDDTWKRQHHLMTMGLGPQITRLSNSESESQESAASSTLLEKPLTKIVIPVIDDKSGKFPELGDGEIVGPMAVAPPRVVTGAETSLDARHSPAWPHKRSLLKFLSDMFHA